VRTADVALEIVQSHVALLELVIELLLCIGRVEISDLGVHILIGAARLSLAARCCRISSWYLVEDGEAPDVCFLRRWLLSASPRLAL